MVFSSLIFLCIFLPAVFILYGIIPSLKVRNVILMIASLIFYAYGEPVYVLLMIGSSFFNYLFARLVSSGPPGKRKAWLVTALIVNLGLLCVFKYAGMIVSSINGLFGTSIPDPQIILPIGISFFTFQALSYVIDVYRGHVRAQKNYLYVQLYIAFFPQLIAGPIVRYQTVADEIQNRKENLDDFIEGTQRFMRGLCKKMLLANNLGLLVDTAFALETSQLSVVSAWLAACAYLMQVYYDFSGYSDMAIGLGRMFGFHFLENFTYPFICKTVGEFWKRWHISLGSWFTDYLYIPLGGSRVKTPRLVFNMMVVWTLTGLWHGAAWTYFLWGFGFGVFLVLERLTGMGKWMSKHAVGHFYAMFVVVTITVMIRSDNLHVARIFYGSMFGLNGAGLVNPATGALLREYGWFLLAAIVCSLPVGQWLREKLHVPDAPIRVLSAIGLLVCTVIAFSYVSVVDYNPFIYFNF